LLGKRNIVDENGAFLWARIDIVEHNDELIERSPVLDLAELLEWDGYLLPLVRDTAHDVSRRLVGHILQLDLEAFGVTGLSIPFDIKVQSAIAQLITGQ
jgi:hypothetical protein